MVKIIQVSSMWEYNFRSLVSSPPGMYLGLTRWVARRLTDAIRRGSQVLQNAADLPGVFLSVRGECDPVASPYEQFGSQIAFDQPHMTADGA